MPPIEEFFTISWAKDPVRVERGQRAAATLRAKQQAKKGARGAATAKGAVNAASTTASTRAAAAEARAKARAQAAASRQRRVQAAKRRIARAQVRQADRGVRTAGRATQRAARVLAKARAALATAKASVTRATQAHRGAVRAEARAARHRAKVARKVGRIITVPAAAAAVRPIAAVAAPIAAPAAGFIGFGSWGSHPAPAAPIIAPASVHLQFDKPVEPPVGGFGFKSTGRTLAFDGAWLATSSQGMSGKCDISGWTGEVRCTESVAPGGGTVTARAAALRVFMPTGGAVDARRSACRFIVNVKGGGAMRHTFVGLLPSTAQATPRANVQGLGGWMLNVSDGTVSSSVSVTVSGARPVVVPGGAVEMMFDYDSQKCFIAVYTPEAVAARYPQPPQHVALLEFAGKPFPAYGALYPAVSLYQDGTSVRVEEDATARTLADLFGPAPAGLVGDGRDPDDGDAGVGDMPPRDGFDDDGAFYEGPPMAQDAPPANWTPIVVPQQPRPRPAWVTNFRGYRKE